MKHTIFESILKLASEASVSHLTSGRWDNLQEAKKSILESITASVKEDGVICEEEGLLDVLTYVALDVKAYTEKDECLELVSAIIGSFQFINTVTRHVNLSEQWLIATVENAGQSSMLSMLKAVSRKPMEMLISLYSLLKLSKEQNVDERVRDILDSGQMYVLGPDHKVANLDADLENGCIGEQKENYITLAKRFVDLAERHLNALDGNKRLITGHAQVASKTLHLSTAMYPALDNTHEMQLIALAYATELSMVASGIKSKYIFSDFVLPLAVAIENAYVNKLDEAEGEYEADTSKVVSGESDFEERLCRLLPHFGPIEAALRFTSGLDSISAADLKNGAFSVIMNNAKLQSLDY